ncbi:MAG: hypothetical protein U1E65_28475 [Myxococcota bacterium]
MAKPPEPLAELIPAANLIVVAVVVAVLWVGPKPPPPPAAEELGRGATSVGYRSPAQKVRLKIEKTLLGKAKSVEIEVEKPEAGYLLDVGHRGPFFIDKDGKIIGRYGPDTHREEAILKALRGN